MKKKLIVFVLVLALALMAVIPAFAQEADGYRLIDVAELLSSEEWNEVSAKLDDVSNSMQYDLAVVTLDSLNGEGVEAAAEEIFMGEDFGFGENRDGAILLISMEERDWTIRARGLRSIENSDEFGEYVGEKIQPMLSSGDYAGAFIKFAELTEKCVVGAPGSMRFRAPFAFFKNLLIALAFGVIIALIVVGSMKKQLKSVHKKTAAAEYVVQNSLNITESRERFLYHTVTRTPKPKSNSSSSGSSGGGGGFGGASGKF